MLNDKVEYNSSLFRYFIYRSFRREKWLEYISVYKTTRVHRISNRIYPFPVTNNRDNINARNFSLFRLIHEKPIRFPDPPPCVFFKHSVHRFANFAPGGFPSNEIPSRISIPPRISWLNFENASSVVRYYFEDSTFSLSSLYLSTPSSPSTSLLLSPSEADFADRL